MPPTEPGTAYAAVVTFEASVAMTEDEFGAAARTSYKANLADMFADVTPDMITLRVLAGSIVVVADIATTYSPAVAQTLIVSVLAAATPSTLSTSLGVSVTAVQAPVVAVVAIMSPPPSPPVPDAAGGSSPFGVIIAAIVAVVVIVVVCGVVIFGKKSSFVTHQPLMGSELMGTELYGTKTATHAKMGSPTPEAMRPDDVNLTDTDKAALGA